MPFEQAGQQKLPTIHHDTLVFHSIYEHFVKNFYRIHLKNWNVKPQHQLSWHAKQENSYLPSMKPDLILQDKISGNTIVLDTKFTAESLKENRWGKKVFDSSHLYQIYTYLKSQEHLSDQHRKASGILLYPVVHYNLSERIELEDHIIRIECLDLTVPWQDIERQLIDLVTRSKIH
jgi:5-methylcytosine-specific restriction enzyme subunit McrC